MKTKIAYILTSDNTDYYLEQTLVSIYSVRLHNSDAEIILVVDTETNNTLIEKRKIITKYISQKIIVETPYNYSKMQRSRFLKTTLRRHISGDYLFMDSDTIITDDLSEIDNVPFDIAAVPDKHVMIKNHPRYKYIKEWAKVANWNLIIDRYYFNSGVFYVKDSPLTHLFYEKWFHIWSELSTNKGINIDQPSLAKVDEMHNYIIKELDGIWNCQINENGLPFLSNAKVIHYFASAMKGKRSNPYYFYNNKIYEKIKREGVIDQDLHTKILHAKSMFTTPCIIIGDTDVPFFFSNIYQIYMKAKFAFMFIEFISNTLISIGRFTKKL